MGVLSSIIAIFFSAFVLARKKRRTSKINLKRLKNAGYQDFHFHLCCEMVKALFGANAAHKNENRLRGTTPHGNPMHLSKKVVYNIRKNNLPDNSPMCVLTLVIVHLDSNFTAMSLTDYTLSPPLLLLAEWQRSKCWNSQTHIFFLISMGSASHTQQVPLLPLFLSLL
jgi:hypothetical protein